MNYQHSCIWLLRAISTGVKRLGREANQWPRIRAKFKERVKQCHSSIWRHNRRASSSECVNSSLYSGALEFKSRFGKRLLKTGGGGGEFLVFLRPFMYLLRQQVTSKENTPVYVKILPNLLFCSHNKGNGWMRLQINKWIQEKLTLVCSAAWPPAVWSNNICPVPNYHTLHHIKGVQWKAGNSKKFLEKWFSLSKPKFNWLREKPKLFLHRKEFVNELRG